MRLYNGQVLYVKKIFLLPILVHNLKSDLNNILHAILYNNNDIIMI